MPDAAKLAPTEAPSPIKSSSEKSRTRARRPRTKLSVANGAKPKTGETTAPLSEQHSDAKASTPLKSSLARPAKTKEPDHETASASVLSPRSNRRREAPPAVAVPKALEAKVVTSCNQPLPRRPLTTALNESNTKVESKPEARRKADSSLSAHAPVFRTKQQTQRAKPTTSEGNTSEAVSRPDSRRFSAPPHRQLEATVRRVVMQQLSTILGDGGSHFNMLGTSTGSHSSGGTAMPGHFDLPEPPKSACSTTSAPLCFEDANAQPANLYINGLPAHTTDDHLLALASRFGNVKSHKAMINKETGLCEGFGFVLYHTHEEARSAMMELARLGLQPSWARESFNSQLRRMADLHSANIYLSNLPKDMGSEGLERLVAPHQILSQRILTDANGASRGVGFVRLRDRSLAEDCIAKLNGKILPGQVIPLQVRFADSEAQKQLKQANHAVKKASQIATPPLQTFGSSSFSNAPGLGFTLYDPYAPTLGGLATASNSFSPINFASPGMGIFGLQPGSPLIPVGSIPGYSATAPGYANLGTPSAGFSLMGANGFSSDFSPSSFTNLSSLYSPASPYSAGSAITSAATSPGTLHPSGTVSPSDSSNGHGKLKASRSVPNSRFVPPELAQQHAMALMSSWQAQDALRTFGAPALGREQASAHLASSAAPFLPKAPPADPKSIAPSISLDAVHNKVDHRSVPTTTA